MENFRASSQVHGRTLMGVQDFTKQLNTWGEKRTPFFFLSDFELKNLQAWKIQEINPDELLFEFNGVSNIKRKISSQPITLEAAPESPEHYQQKFDHVVKHLSYGNSFLVNLTIKTPIKLSCDLKDVFFSSKAKYKLWKKDSFVLFSPECFIQIQDRTIRAYPMKGTIDASLPDAKNKILSDQKELAEHVTIVDLIRNDLSIIAEDVQVTRFRFIDEVVTHHKTLLQVSSEISGRLKDNYLSQLGDIVISLLPAGSISGAPKDKTVEIIKEAEKEERGFFTGVAGYFDGEKLDSAVLIRFIEQSGKKFYYRSGGGITTQSNTEDEYNEAIAKVYVPIY
jgi:para-aminobenzoate synthetase component 1